MKRWLECEVFEERQIWHSRMKINKLVSRVLETSSFSVGTRPALTSAQTAVNMADNGQEHKTPPRQEVPDYQSRNASPTRQQQQQYPPNAASSASLSRSASITAQHQFLPPSTPRHRTSSSSSQPPPQFMQTPTRSQSRAGSRTSSRAGNRRRPSAADYEMYYFGAASPSHVRHFSSAQSLPQFRNKLAALSLTASGQESRYLGGSSSAGEQGLGTGGNRKYRSSQMMIMAEAAGIGRGNTATGPGMNASTNNNFVVLDIGNRFVKAGFAGDAEPRCEVPVEMAWARVSQTPSNYFSPDTRAADNDQNILRDDEEDDIEDSYLHSLWELRDIATVCPLDRDGASGLGVSGQAWYKTHHRQRLECILETLLRYIFSRYVD